MSRALKIILIFFSVAMIVLLAWFWYSNNQEKRAQTSTQDTSQEQTPEEATSENVDNLANINAQTYDTILKSNFSVAKEKALLWQNDAQFVFLKIQIPADLNLRKITETYVFTSEKSKSLYWTMGLDLEQNYIRALIWKEDFLKEESPKLIATQFWKTDWISAFQKADKNDGQEFRDKYDDDLTIAINLTYAQPNNYLYWIVKYQSLTSGDTVSIQIDANTGDLVPESSESESTSSEANPTLDNVSQ